AEVARWTEIPEREIEVGVDGCGVATFAVPLAALAGAFARLGSAAQRIFAAIRRHPEYVAGIERLCTDLIRATGGRVVAKVGAEGVYVATVPEEGVGIALKVEDGARRAVEPALLGVLKDLGLISAEEYASLERYAEPVLTNTRGEAVGVIRTVVSLEAARGRGGPCAGGRLGGARRGQPGTARRRARPGGAGRRSCRGRGGPAPELSLRRVPGGAERAGAVAGAASGAGGPADGRRWESVAGARGAGVRGSLRRAIRASARERGAAPPGHGTVDADRRVRESARAPGAGARGARALHRGAPRRVGRGAAAPLASTRRSQRGSDAGGGRSGVGGGVRGSARRAGGGRARSVGRGASSLGRAAADRLRMEWGCSSTTR